MSSTASEAMSDQFYSCHTCGGELTEFFSSTLPFSVSSNSLPINAVTRIHECRTCQLLQKTPDSVYASYVDYSFFDNNPRADKLIFTNEGTYRSRSEIVAELIFNRMGIDRQLRLLEIGCHRGAFLSVVSSLAPHYESHGYDLDPSYATLIQQICGPGTYHHGDLGQVPGTFDVIVLIHTFEHIQHPGAVLKTIDQLLSCNGLLVIVVPDVLSNPVDLFVIDHASHFAAPVLERTLDAKGFRGRSRTDIIKNEQIILAGKETLESETSSESVSYDAIQQALLHLEQCIRAIPADESLIFGTAVIAGLLAGALGDRCIGFIDDSPFQIGNRLLGKAIIPIEEARGKRVVLGVAEHLAGGIAERLRRVDAEVINPWALVNR